MKKERTITLQALFDPNTKKKRKKKNNNKHKTHLHHRITNFLTIASSIVQKKKLAEDLRDLGDAVLTQCLLACTTNSWHVRNWGSV